MIDDDQSHYVYIKDFNRFMFHKLECGSNINKAVLGENLEETIIKRQRLLMILWHQKMLLFKNLLFPKNLHYSESLHALNIRLLWKGPE